MPSAIPRFFKNVPQAGKPLSMRGLAAGLAAMARALEKMEVHNGKVDWANGVPRIIVQSVGGGSVALPFYVASDGEDTVSISSGRCYWWNPITSAYDIDTLGGTEISAAASSFIHVKLTIDGSGNGSWAIEVASTNKTIADVTQSVRYWLIAEIDADGLITQRWTGDIYETRAG